MDLVWGLYLYTLINGMGFEISHSLTSLNSSFYSRSECSFSAQKMNEMQSENKQLGLDRGIQLRYICVAVPKKGKSI